MIKAKAAQKNQKQPTNPPGRIKIAKAMISLLKKKSFDSITWAEIAKTAGVNEALIYKYFKDKRSLLHAVLDQYNADFLKLLRRDLEEAEGTFDKIRTFISSTLSYYQETPVFAKILIVEVRSFPAFFQSETYEQLRDYANMLLAIIEEGVRRGEIRSDLSPRHIRQMINGAIEHLCLPKIVFGTNVKTQAYTDDICKFVFNGISKPAETGRKKAAPRRKPA